MNVIFRWLSHCPLSVLHFWGGIFGWLIYWTSPTYRRRFKTHVQHACIPWSQGRLAIAHAGRMVFELPYLWLRPPYQSLGPKLHFEGAQHVEQAQKEKRGVLFLTPHLGAFEVAAQACAERFGAQHPLTVLYRPARKRWLRNLIDTGRQRPHLHTAPASLAGVRQMLRSLKKGHCVGLLPDQVPPLGLGVWASFWGRPAYTMTLAVRLAVQTQAAVILIWCERLPQGQGYIVRCEPLKADLPSGPDALTPGACIINQAMEQMILRCPSQYLWGYNRFKQPPFALTKE